MHRDTVVCYVYNMWCINQQGRFKQGQGIVMPKQRDIRFDDEDSSVKGDRFPL